MSSLAEAYPQEQARIRASIAVCQRMNLPELGFYIAVGEDLLRRADSAAMSGDIVQMLTLFREMQEFKD